MTIDDPFEAVDKQYPEGRDIPMSEITLGASSVALGFPIFSPLAIFMGFIDSFTTSKRVERALAFIRVLNEQFKNLETQVKSTKIDVSEVQAALRVALSSDLDEFNNKKRDRYISIVTSAIALPTKVTDLAGFIRDVERLNEHDLIGLRVLNRVMNKQGDWPEQPTNFASQLKPKLHPNTFIQRAQELSVQMAQALCQNFNITDGDQFNREEGLQICLRLQGFGLAEQISTSPREVPISNYSARLTTRGLMLLSLLGEHVPNWNRYFDTNGPL